LQKLSVIFVGISVRSSLRVVDCCMDVAGKSTSWLSPSITGNAGTTCSTTWGSCWYVLCCCYACL